MIDNKINININGVNIDWDLKTGNLNFLGISSTLFWNDPSLLNMFKPLIDEIGKEMYCLQVAYSSSQGTHEDYNQMVRKLGNNFEEGVLNWGKAVSAAGWGIFEIEDFNKKDITAKIIVHNPWELKMQESLSEKERWGCPFLQGKIIGIFRHEFNHTFWTDEEYFFDKDSNRVEFNIYKSELSIENRITELREEKEKEKILKLKDIIDKELKEKNILIDNEKSLRKNLIKSENELKLIFSNAQVGLMYITGDRRLIKANQKLADIFGYKSPDEMYGMSMLNLHISKKNFISYGKENFEALRLGTKHNIEYQLKRKDGTPVWCELSGKAFDNNFPADLSKGVLWVVSDISIRKKNQKDFEDSEFLRKNIISSIPDLLWMKDEDGTYIACNSRFEDFFGAKEKDILGKNDYDFLPAEDVEFFREHDKNAMRADKPVSNFEEITFACDGHKEYLHTTKTKILDSSGKIFGVLGVGRDISELKKADDFLKKTNEILEMIATGEEAHKVYDEIALMYESRHKGMRCSLLELKEGKLMHGGAPSMPQEYCAAVNGLEYGPEVGSCGTSTFTGERVLVENIETDPKWADIKDAALPHGMRSCWSEPIKNSSGKVLGAFGMYYDYPSLPNKEESDDLSSAARLASIVMEREQAQNRIFQNQKIIANQTKLASMGEMIGNIAHQWRQPLSIISTTASGLKLKTEIEEKINIENIKKFSDLIVEQSSYLSRTIDNFRDFIKEDINFSKVSIKKSIEQSLRLVDATLKNNFINVVLDIQDDMFIDGNLNELSQAFINIINNSKDALIHNIDNHSNRFLFINAKPVDDSSYEIEITDSGKGINENIVNKIFEPYFTTKHQSQGTGLGLTIVDNIIRQRHKGFVKVSNKEYEYNNTLYKGVCFKIKLFKVV